MVGDRSELALNHHLRIADKHVDMLCGMPEFRDLTTAQLLKMLPNRYRHAVPPVSYDVREHVRVREERMTRAVVIGMLATEAQIESHAAVLFMERS
jgi:hypothetical protein